MYKRRAISYIILVLSLGSASWAQQKTPQNDPTCAAQVANLDTWIPCRMAQVLAARMTQRNPTKQTASPDIAQSSTSLVDHTSAADLATAALNAAGIGSGNNGGGGTVTASLYSIISAINHHDALDPAYYNLSSSAQLRQWSFTAGLDNANATTKTMSQSSNATPKVVGVAYLIINRRDLANNSGKITDIQQKLGNLGTITALITHAVQDFLHIQSNLDLAPALDKLTGTQTENLNSIFEAYADRYYAAVTNMDKDVKSISTAPQWSVSGQGEFHDANDNDHYRAETAFEWGWGQFDWTTNGSFEYINSPKIGADTRGGRFATDFKYQLGQDAKLSGRKPVALDLSGEGDWLQSLKGTYTGQLTLTIPLIDGIDLPLTASYSSRTNVILLKEAGFEGKLGLSFDVSRLAKAFVK